MSSIIEIYAKIFKKLLHEKRVLVVTGAIAGTTGALMFMSESFAYSLREIFFIDVQRTGLLLLLVSTVSATLIYLQSGGGKSLNDSSNSIEEFKEYLDLSTSRISSLEAQVASNQAMLDTLRPTIELTNEERRAALNEVVAQSSESAIKSIFEVQSKTFHDDLKKSLSLERLGTASTQIVGRLRREITDLRLRSNVNLMIGMSITAGGLYLLWSTVTMVDTSQLLKTLASEGNESNAKFLKNLLLPIAPRVLLVIFVEIFAYFFLRLYKNGLSEIKYFQNELTNIESKLISLEFSFLAQNQESLKSSLEALSRTERNFILEKNQTTVELERAKSESNLTKTVLEIIPEIFKRSEKREP